MESCEIFSKNINCDLNASAAVQECQDVKISLIEYCSSKECQGNYGFPGVLPILQQEFTKRYNHSMCQRHTNFNSTAIAVTHSVVSGSQTGHAFDDLKCFLTVDDKHFRPFDSRQLIIDN